MDLSIEHWERAAPAERVANAKRLASQLPLGFKFQSIRRYELGESGHHVAIYENGNATFALVPGGPVRLGYDQERPFQPNADELASWQGTAAEYEMGATLREYIAQVTLRIRQVELSPFLIETAAEELGWEAVGLEDPEVKEIRRKHRNQRQVEVSRGQTRLRVRTSLDGVTIAERSVPVTHAELAAQFADDGFRFPTSDEWEYACGGGAQTLFRWGDHVPCDRYPTDISPEEAAWRKQWVLSKGALERPAEAFASDWDFHRQPNAFGLSIASDPYKSELVAELGITRGGDGGCTVCGGAGFFIGWLALATAYFEEHSCKYDPSESTVHRARVHSRTPSVAVTVIFPPLHLLLCKNPSRLARSRAGLPRARCEVIS